MSPKSADAEGRLSGFSTDYSANTPNMGSGKDEVDVPLPSHEAHRHEAASLASRESLQPAEGVVGTFLRQNSLLLGLLGVGLITCLLVALVVRGYRSKNKKAKQLAAILPKVAVTRPVSYGIRGDQAIEFVVPTITVPETTPYSVTEDSMSDSDCFGITSGSDREAGPSTRRIRHPAGRYAISPHEINKRLYLDCEQRRQNQVGRVNFVLHYSHYRQQLLVTLLSALELPLNEKRHSVNPFAKVRLLPEKTPKFVTKMQRNNANPLFNELFIFPAKKAGLENRVLRISLWHYDRFSRKYFIGQSHFRLGEAGITSAADSDVITDEVWRTLKGPGQYSAAGSVSH